MCILKEAQRAAKAQKKAGGEGNKALSKPVQNAGNPNAEKVKKNEDVKLEDKKDHSSGGKNKNKSDKNNIVNKAAECETHKRPSKLQTQYTSSDTNKQSGEISPRKLQPRSPRK